MNRFPSTWVWLLALNTFFAFTQERPIEYQINRTDAKIKIDGVLKEPIWQESLTTELAYEWFPGNNEPASKQTIAYLTYDDDYLYLAFRAFDNEPSKIRARYGRRDQAFSDDRVVLYLDTNDAQRNAYIFMANPLGVQIDAIRDDVYKTTNYDWDGIWQSAGNLNKDGYTVEMAIPFNQLRFPDKPNQTWGILLLRSYNREKNYSNYSQPDQEDRDCLLCKFGRMSGLKNLKQPLALSLTPTVTTQRTDTRDVFPDGPLVSGDEDTEVGATLRWLPNSDSRLVATINPDFSTVEADAAQLNVNERFALFFPEKRPFFLDSAEYFNTPLSAVFTRTVFDPEVGAKYTGQNGDNQWGMMYTRDRVNNLFLPSNQSTSFYSQDEEIDGGVLRFRRQLGSRASIGGLATLRNGDTYHNYVKGLDGHVRLGRADNIRFQLLHSDTQYDPTLAGTGNQPEDAFTGWAGLARYNHNTRYWDIEARYRQIDKEFRGDFGFFSRADFREYHFETVRKFYEKSPSWYHFFQVDAEYTYIEDLEGQKTDVEKEVGFYFQGPAAFEASGAFTQYEELFAGRYYQGSQRQLYAEKYITGDIYFNLSYEWGETIDYSNRRNANYSEINSRLFIFISRYIQADLNYTDQKLDVAEGEDLGELFNAKLWQLNAEWHFNARLYFRGTAQYLDLERQTSRYLRNVNPESETLFTQFILSYQINSETLGVLGYSDNAEGYNSVDLRQTDRTFFAKLSYVFFF